MSARAIAVLVVLAALIAGSAAQARVAEVDAAARPRGGYLVLTGDFHVHGFPGDGALAPWDLAREARRRRIDVIALTNHNQMIASELWMAVPHPAAGALVIPGDEVTSGHYHMAAVGLAYPIDWNQSAASAARAIQAQGGVAIAAHPIGRRTSAWHDAAALVAVDGIEAAHPEMHLTDESAREFAEVYGRAVRAHPAIAAIGSSDFHFLAPIGLCRTYLFTRSASEAGVLEAIRAGRTVACDALGRVHGREPLAGMVAADCAADASSPPVAANAALDRVATAIAWLGLAALILL